MSPVIEILPATVDHIPSLAARMRQADIDEVFASSGQSPADALEFSLRKSSLCMTALIDGEPEVMFGVGDVSVLSRVGAPWLLGTDAVVENYVAFLRGSVEWRDQLLSRYWVLRNFVDDRNTVAKRWLKWLGFKLSDPVSIGHEGRAFRMFELRSE